jgi:hypothetical protein
VSNNFAYQANEFLLSTGADMATFSPIVDKQARFSWETFSGKNQGWVEEGLEFEGRLDYNIGAIPIDPSIYPNLTEKSHTFDVALPFWQTAPVPDSVTINYDLLEIPVFQSAFQYVEKNRHPILTEVVDPSILSDVNITDGHPRFFIVAPLFDPFTSSKKLVGIFTAIISWQSYFKSVAYQGDGLVLVVANSCGDLFTYSLLGQESTFLGDGDLHDSRFDSMSQTISFEAFQRIEHVHGSRDCHYNITVYPSEAKVNEYHTNTAATMTLMVLAVFVTVSVLFIIYDRLVQARQVSIVPVAS